MAKFGANYGEKYKLCPLCKEHLDSQDKSFEECQVIKVKIRNIWKYEEICLNPSQEIAKVLREIMKLRED